MKKALLFIVACSLLACSKKSDNNNSNNNVSPTNPTGTIEFINNSSNDYDVYINGALQTMLAGHHYITYTLDYGNYVCEVKQIDGYLLVPTDETFNGTISASSNIVVSFP